MQQKMNLKEEDFIKIMQMYRENIDSRLIANRIGIGQVSVSTIIRAFNGSEIKLSLLHKDHQEIIRKISPFYIKQNVIKNKETIYICKILFGVIKLKFEPQNINNK